LQEAYLPQIAIKQLIDTCTFILKGINGASIGNSLNGINGASIGNVFECHVRRVRETRAMGKSIFTEKAPITRTS
jgi:hypothetical protein